MQVVSLDWKWLFIYPEQGVASVNELVVPADVPVHFSLTSASVMNAFFVPQLGSMICAMNGMVTQLNLQADQPGDYYGQSAQFSGDGFPDMNFIVRAVPPDAVRAWVARGAANGAGARSRGLSSRWRSRARTCAPFTYRAVDAGPVRRHRNAEIAAGPGPAGGATAARQVRPQEELIAMLGKLTWYAIPFDQPIPLIAGGGRDPRRARACSPGSSSKG